VAIDWSTIEQLRDASVHVVGLASTEGASIVRFLWSEGVRNITVHDFQSQEAIEATFRRMHVGVRREARDAMWSELSALPIERRFGERYLEGIEGADAVFAGQAWYMYPPNLPRLSVLRERGVPFHGMTELYFGLWPAPIIAVTGSNGKSTTSRLIETILRQTDKEIHYAGNERRSVQALDAVRSASPAGWLVLEVSNRQLMDIEPRPRIGVLTNVLPNHLDEHGGSMEAYSAVKRRLFTRQAPSDMAVLNADNEASRALARGLPGRVYWFSRQHAQRRGAWLDDERGVVMPLGNGREPMVVGPLPTRHLRGGHNAENAMAACLASALAGASLDAIQRGLRAFRGLRHRIQFVWALDGVEYYDDLSATTPLASAAALHALEGPIVMIAGGGDKGLDLEPLVAAMVAKVRWLVLLPGEGSERIERAVRSASPMLPVTRCETLREAVEKVVAGVSAGDRVLLSPACPYFFRMHYLSGRGVEQGFRSLLRSATGQQGSQDGRSRVSHAHERLYSSGHAGGTPPTDGESATGTTNHT
jgi:UDP-N-acetylmuramoylalanine--D-glutamate ligase